MKNEFQEFCFLQDSCNSCEFNYCNSSDECREEYTKKYGMLRNIHNKLDILANKMDTIIELLKENKSNGNN